MNLVSHNSTVLGPLKSEIKLQINQHLYDRGIISREVYEQAKVRLVSST